MNAKKSQNPEHEPERKAGSRVDRGPGAHSGAESQAKDRVVPGTASAREGYRTEGGTAHGESLTGVESTGEERGVPRSDKGGLTDTPAARKRHR